MSLLLQLNNITIAQQIHTWHKDGYKKARVSGCTNTL